jgi:hypothetical protein
MTNAKLTDLKAGRQHHCGDKGLQQLEREKRRNNLPAHHPELAATVVKMVAEQATADEVCQARHGQTEQRVVPIVAPTAGKIEPLRFQVFQESGQVARIILTVAIHGENELAPRGPQAIEQGRSLPAVLGLVQDATLRPPGDAQLNLVGRSIGTTVVDEDRFPIAVHHRQNLGRAGDQGQDVTRFVEKRDHERIARGRVHGVSAMNTVQMKPGRNPMKDSLYRPLRRERTASVVAGEAKIIAASQSSGGSDQ